MGWNVNAIAPPPKFGGFEEPVARATMGRGYDSPTSVDVREAERFQAGCSSLVLRCKLPKNETANLLSLQRETVLYQAAGHLRKQLMVRQQQTYRRGKRWWVKARN